MATFDYESLKKKYDDFSHPISVIQVNGKNIADGTTKIKDEDGTEITLQFAVSDIEVEMTSGFEAAMATFRIFNCYDRVMCQFQFDDLKKYILLGSGVVVSLGYGGYVREVFRGFIARVNFIFQEKDIPCVEVTAMDIKGIMMSGSYSRQLKATSFSDAVEEILEKTAYSRLRSNGIITDLKIADTPDKGGPGGTSQQQKASDKTIEMVCESDYEFVVKAAKKFNYEFFSVGGTVYFRKAKDASGVLMEISPGAGLRSFDVGYDLTGLVEKVEVRGMDVGKSKMISASQKLSNKVSQGSKAKPLLSKSQKVYIDPTISSREEALYRVEYLAEDISYRLGSLEAELIGLPELTPGTFIKVSGLGKAASNTFYLATVRHLMDGELGFVTKVEGKAASMEAL